MVAFRGVLTGDCKPTDCSGEYQEIDDAGSIRGYVELKKRIDPGSFRLTLADGGTLEIVIPYLMHDASRGRHRSRSASRADFEGKLIRSAEPAA